MKTTLPPIHPNSMWTEKTSHLNLPTAEPLEETWADFAYAQRWFPSRLHAGGFVNWKLRQLRAHGCGPTAGQAGGDAGSAA